MCFKQRWVCDTSKVNHWQLLYGVGTGSGGQLRSLHPELPLPGQMAAGSRQTVAFAFH